MVKSRFTNIRSIPSKVATGKSAPNTTNFADGIATYQPNDTMKNSQLRLAENARFEQRIVTDVNELEREIDNFNNVLIANTKAINERTDLVVQENNTYLLNQMREYLADILVVNYITGEDMSIQDMFDYLCMYHLTDPITYTELAGKECTYTTLASYDMTYTQLVTNGGTIIE